MYPITNEVKALFEAEQPKVLRITGTDRNGATISITDDNVIADSFQIDRYSCNGEKLEVGTAVAAQMTMTLENGDGTYDDIAFEGAELFVEVGVADWTQESPTVYWVPCGYFTPDEQPRRLSTISITALDRMTKFDVVVDAADLTFPTTIAGLVGQVCTLSGVTLAQSISGLVNAGVNVAELPTAQEEITYRNLIQWCAGIMGTNAWFDWNGQLRFSWYENATGYVSTVDNRYSSDLYEDDLTVSGVEYTNDSGIVIVEGTDDYAIDLTGNAIVGPLVATVLSPLNTALNGFTYRPFTAATVNAPYLWPMDIVTFTDKDENNHTSALTNVAFGLNGTTAMESKGMTYAINKLAQPKGFTREQAQLVNQAMEHVEQDIDESLTQQEIFNRLTNNGAAQGIVLYNGQLYINASYINAGYLSADHIQGGTLTLGGQGNQNGVLQVLDASGNVITVLNNAGADITNGSLTTYSTDRQTRTILSDGLLKFQFYNSAAQPIGWRDALRLAADSQSATIGTFAGIAQLDIKGRGRVYISNQDAVTDEHIAELDLDDDLARLHAYTWGEGTTNLDVQGDGLTLTIDNQVGDPFIFHLIEGQSDHPLSVGNGGTGANTAAGARTNLGVPSGADGVLKIPSITDDDDAIPDTSLGPAFAVYKLTGSSSTIGNDGNIISMPWCSGDSYGSQIFVDCDPTYNISLRQRNVSGVWNAWKRIPMGDGTGASGTWGIAITGNAATATTLQTSRSLWGNSFNGSADINGSIAMTSGSRLHASGGDLYLGNANNANWLMVQDICSQDSRGDGNWSLRTNGTAHLKTLYLVNALGVEYGGTGATTAAGARANLGVPEIVATSSQGLQASLRFTGADGHSYGLGIFGKGQSYKIGLYDNTSNEWAWRI